MSYVFFDLEWNQGYPRGEADRLDEIIQIGAFRMDDWCAEGESFCAYVRPTVHKKLHHRVRKMLPLEQEEMLRADRFPDVVSRFFAWCGPDASFFTWGPGDARVLDQNLIWYGMEEYLSVEVRDLQRVYDVMFRKSDQQGALKDAVEAFGLRADLEFHNAENDAIYTARIGSEMVHRLGDLPTERELQNLERELARRKKEDAVQKAASELERVWEEEVPLMERDCGAFPSKSDAPKSRSARTFRCPKCENRLCSGNWYGLKDDCVARSSCGEHGRFYTVLHQTRGDSGWSAVIRVYDGDAFPPSLFSLCKFGGELIEVRKLPRRRKHGRGRSKAKSAPPTEKKNQKA